MNELVTMILQYLLYFAGVAIMSLIAWAAKKYFFPWLQTKLGKDNFEKLEEYARRFMAAAEEKVDVLANGKEKSEWVIGMLIERNIIKDTDTDKKYAQAVIDGLMKPLEKEGIVNTDKA